MGTTNIPKRLPTNDRVDIRNPVTRAKTSEKISRKEKLSGSRRRDSERNFSDHFGTPSENAGYIKTLGVPSRTERISQVNVQIGHS